MHQFDVPKVQYCLGYPQWHGGPHSQTGGKSLGTKQYPHLTIWNLTYIYISAYISASAYVYIYIYIYMYYHNLNKNVKLAYHSFRPIGGANFLIKFDSNNSILHWITSHELITLWTKISHCEQLMHQFDVPKVQYCLGYPQWHGGPHSQTGGKSLGTKQYPHLTIWNLTYIYISAYISASAYVYIYIYIYMYYHNLNKNVKLAYHSFRLVGGPNFLIKFDSNNSIFQWITNHELITLRTKIWNCEQLMHQFHVQPHSAIHRFSHKQNAHTHYTSLNIPSHQTRHSFNISNLVTVVSPSWAVCSCGLYQGG